MGNLESFMGRFGDFEQPEETEKPGALAAFVGKFGGMSESFFFYSGSVEIRFDKVEHQYFLVNPELGNLTPLLNVSTVAHIIDRSFALVPWASKTAIEKLLRTIPVKDGQVCLNFEEFTKIALEAKSAHKDILDDAGDVGHAAHNWIEAEIKSRISGTPNTLVMPEDERAKNCCYAALKWMEAHNVRWLETERKVYSKKHQCSGTMDGLAYTDSCTDPVCCQVSFKDHLSLIDWKTSNYLYTEYLYQTAAYLEFFTEEFPDQPVNDRWVIRLGKEDAEFDPWYLPPETFAEDLSGFLACLALKRIVLSVEERMKSQKSRTRAIKKEVRAIEKEKQLLIKCKNADKYKGTRKPRCNNGNPCETCLKKYEENNKENE